MQYPLFCSSHDSSLFKELESHNSIPFSKRDCLLLAYRAACSVRHQEERRMHFYGYKVKENSGDLNVIMLENSWAFIHRMDAVIHRARMRQSQGLHLIPALRQQFVPRQSDV